MFAFMKKRIYRRQFIIYTIALFLACFIVYVALLKTTVSAQVDRAHQEALSYFQNAENTISTSKQQIDSFFMQLYSSENVAVLADLQRFIGSNAEEYILKRLNDLSASEMKYSFIESVKTFIANNLYTVSQVTALSLDEGRTGNIIALDPSGRSNITFRIADPFGAEDDFSEGILYTKTIPDPGSRSNSLGELVFTITLDVAFPQPPASMIGTLAVMSKSSEIFLGVQDESAKEIMRTVYSGAANYGAYGGGLISPANFAVFTAEGASYKLVSLVRFDDIASSNPAMIFGPLLGMLFIFAVVTTLLAIRMSVDARRLDQITGAIDSAKAGRFTKIDLGKKDDEYSIIADELNNMSDALNAYIEKEYALKLRQKEAEMQILQQQIHPHFLYNTLEVIRSRALMNHDYDVADAVFNMGTMFRAMIKTEDVITVEAEIDILIKYLKLMEFKFAGSFFYQIDVGADLLMLSTIKFWMQPLAENFFVHGFDKENPLNLIVLKGSTDGDTICFEMMNNGRRMQEEALQAVNATLVKDAPQKNASIGLQNVYLRLCYFYGDRVQMRLSNNEESGITISIRIEPRGNETTLPPVIPQGKGER